MPICPTCLTTYPADARTCASDGDNLVPDGTFASVDRDLAAGDVVGEYRVVGKLGEGGFGAVYQAEHPVIGKPAAVKVLAREFSSKPEMVSRFIAEARAVNQIRHRNIIDVFSFGQLPDGRQYYVMELLDGQTFDRYLAAQKRLTVEQALPVLRGIARAMDAAHAKGILHRDLKPENVFLVFDEDGHVQPKILDFGLVKLLGDAGASHKTKTGTPMGTPYYMSPEQCRGLEVDARTDVYSFGAMVFEVLTGRVPFEGQSAMDILLKHMSEDPPSASAAAPGVPAEVDLVIRRMMAKSAEHRPATLGEAVDAIAAAAGLAAQSSPRLPRPVTVPVDVDGASATSATVVGRSAEEARPKTAETFVGAEIAGAPRPPRARLVAIAAGALAVGAAVVVATVLRSRPADKPVALIQPTPASAVPSAPQSSAASTASPANSAAHDDAPRDVEVRIDGAPRGAKVTLDGKELGDAPGPFKVRGGSAVTLTVSAKGYKPREVPLSPTADVIVPVSLERVLAPTGPRLNPDLEGFDKK